MNSYPVHFVSHPRPLLFVAGLDSPPTPQPASSSDASVPPLSVDKDEFALLAQRLRELFEKQAGLNVWKPSAAPSAAAGEADGQGKRRERREFRISLVDKDVRLPPVKVTTAPSSQPTSQSPSHSHSHSISLPSRSPLSPHTPNSPVYPDGLIAPVWIRKHTDLLPSNFVLFHKLSAPSTPLADEDGPLIAELSKRRKVLSERGIKLTVVLLASRELLDSPTLDGRLSHLRRSATLDSRSSLFVLTPVSSEELVEFSASLQDVLWESALEYYAAKEKRAARRKRSRGGEGRQVQGGRMLGVEGWKVRDEFKAGFWAEMRSDWETARKHHLQAYAALLQLFSTPHLLPPRTKRWAEAKVLSDALVLRLSRLGLYLGQPSVGLVRHHVDAFRSFGDSWEMERDGWEWASWEGKQWRLMAELLEHAGEEVKVLLAQPGEWGTRVPAETLYGREWYFYEAGRCAERREQAYRAELESGKEGAEERAGWSNEKKVDHLGLIVELYTKAYTLLSALPPPHSRLALHVAHRLALAYSRAGKDDLSRRFWERLGRGYEREGWGASSMLGEEVRQERGRGVEGVEGLWEGVGDGRVDQETFFSYLRDHPSTSSDPIVITSSSTFEAISSFYLRTAFTSSRVPYQLHLNVSEGVQLDQVAFTQLRLEFSDSSEVVLDHDDEGSRIVKLADAKEGKANLRWEKGQGVVVSGWTSSDVAGPISINTAMLRLKQDNWIIDFQLDPNPSVGKPSKSTPRWLASLDPLTSVDLDDSEGHFTRIETRPHLVEVDVTHPAPAYLEESYPVTIAISNKDSRPIDVWLDILVHPSEEQENNVITLCEESSTSLISNVFLGSVQPSATISRTLSLRAEGTSGDRTLDFSVQTRLAAADESQNGVEASLSDLPKPEERTRTLVIPCIRPLSVAFDLKRYSVLGPQRDILALDEEQDEFEKTEEVLLSARFEMLGPTSITVESITYQEQPVLHARSTFSSLPAKDAHRPAEWKQGHSFAAICGFDLEGSADSEGATEEDDLPLGNYRHASPGWYDVAWRRSSADATVTHSKFALPPLFRPLLSQTTEHISALVSTNSSRLMLMEPFTINITIHNTSPSLRSAALHVVVESSDSFAWAGPRSARLPLLLANQSKVIKLRGAALRVGWVKLPGIKLWELMPVENDEPAELRPIVVRMEGACEEQGSRAEEGAAAVESSLQVLVLPP